MILSTNSASATHLQTEFTPLFKRPTPNESAILVTAPRPAWRDHPSLANRPAWPPGRLAASWPAVRPHRSAARWPPTWPAWPPGRRADCHRPCLKSGSCEYFWPRAEGGACDSLPTTPPRAPRVKLPVFSIYYSFTIHLLFYSLIQMLWFFFYLLFKSLI